jgi:phage repressor protein C with HTH and peptisase S24 domain
MTARDELREWMRRVIEAKGSAEQWAADAKTSATNITRFMKDDYASMPTLRTLGKLASCAPFPPPALAPAPSDNATALAPTVSEARQNSGDIDLRRVEINPIVENGKLLPIYASAEGGGGEMVITFDPIEYVKRPAPLENVSDAFGFYCIGDSMSPRYEQGDLILVHPRKPVNRGDDVLVILIAEDNGHSALVKRFERKTDETLFLKQLNPPKTIEISRKKVHEVNLIVGRYNRPR